MNTVKKINLLFGLLVFSLFYLLSTNTAYAANPRLYFSPSSGTYYQGQNFSVDVYLDSAGISHNEGHVEIDFDKTILQVENITENGVYYSFPTSTFDNSNGKVIFQGDFFSNNAYPTSGKLFKINFKVIATSTSYVLSFNESTYLKGFDGVSISTLTKEPATLIFNTPLSNSLLTINSTYDSWSKNDTQTISIDLDTQGNNIDGVDIILNYDKTLFEYQDYIWSGLLPNQQGYFPDTSNGQIIISGVANRGSPVNAKGNILKLTFKALANTDGSNFSFDWTSGSTTDTNIVSSITQNTDLLTTKPVAKSISVIDSATLNFGFNLLNFLGINKTKNGTITVSGPNVISNFIANITSAAANVVDHSLGTFTYGQAYDLVISIPGYLKEKINTTINPGSNGPVSFGYLRPGDTNSDGVVNASDLQELYMNWNRTDSIVQDLNADGKVNTFDVSILYSQFNEIDNL